MKYWVIGAIAALFLVGAVCGRVVYRQAQEERACRNVYNVALLQGRNPAAAEQRCHEMIKHMREQGLD